MSYIVPQPLGKPLQTESLAELLPPDMVQQADRFHPILNTLLNHVNHTQLQAEQRMVELEAGQDNVIETVMAIQKASQTMSLLIQVRNRIVEGYHEVFNQQI